MRSPTLNHSTNTRSTAHPRRPDPEGARQQATSFVSTHRGLVNSPPRSGIGLLRFRTETVPLFGRSHPLLLSRLRFSPSPLPLSPPVVNTQARTSQAIPAIRLKVQYLVAANLLVRACSLQFQKNRVRRGRLTPATDVTASSSLKISPSDRFLSSDFYDCSGHRRYCGTRLIGWDGETSLWFLIIISAWTTCRKRRKEHRSAPKPYLRTP